MAKNKEETKSDEVGRLIEDQALKKKVFEVLQTFRDKDTLDVYEIHDSYEGKPKRIKELQSKGFLGEEVKIDEPSE